MSEETTQNSNSRVTLKTVASNLLPKFEVMIQVEPCKPAPDSRVRQVLASEQVLVNEKNLNK